MRRRTSRPRGQSLVEFALIIPLLLALTGVVIDFARVYQSWENLESASRAAAESLATSDKLDPTTSANANPRAKAIVEAETGLVFSAASSLGSCATATVHATYSTSNDPTLGGSNQYPVGIAKVEACVPFRPLFSYPLLTSNGVWTLYSTRTYSVIQGR